MINRAIWVTLVVAAAVLLVVAGGAAIFAAFSYSHELPALGTLGLVILGVGFIYLSFRAMLDYLF